MVPKGEQLESKQREIVAVHQRFSGPLPAPEILAKYNEIVPGLAERIINMTENQSNHRQYLERITIESDVSNSKLGIVCAFILGLLGIAGGVILGFKGMQIAGSVLGGSSLVTLVSAFIYGTKSRREERTQKREVIAPPPK